MLEKINSVNWSKLKHAYGSASDIPNDLIDLASSNETVRSGAIYNLYGSIFHQGTRYEATPYAIPFLFGLLKQNYIKDKHKIISLLVNLAIGYEEEYLPDGINPKKFRNDLLKGEANMTIKQRENCKKYGYSPLALINCYDLVKDGIPVLLNCLNSKDIKIRNAALHAIAWFPEVAESSIHKIMAVLEGSGENAEIANAILSIGLLGKQSINDIDLSTIYLYLESDSDLIKICSAIALAKHPVESRVLNVLIDGIKLGDKLNRVDGILFNEGRVSGYASKVLSMYGTDQGSIVILALCEALKSVNSYQALDITFAMLIIINNSRTTYIKDERLVDLNPIEIKALESIYKYGGWTLGTGNFVNYVELLKSGGLPDSKQGLGEFLNKV